MPQQRLSKVNICYNSKRQTFQLRHIFLCAKILIILPDSSSTSFMVPFKFTKLGLNTVNSEVFGRCLFSRNFAYAKFHENKYLPKWRNHSVVY